MIAQLADRLRDISVREHKLTPQFQNLKKMPSAQAYFWVEKAFITFFFCNTGKDNVSPGDHPMTKEPEDSGYENQVSLLWRPGAERGRGPDGRRATAVPNSIHNYIYIRIHFKVH